MNKQMIEKLRNREIAIQHTKKMWDYDALISVIQEAFPNDEDYPGAGISKYYYGVEPDGNMYWNSGEELPAGMTAVPLSQFFEEEKQPEITEHLKQVTDENGEFLEYCLANKQKLLLLKEISDFCKEEDINDPFHFISSLVNFSAYGDPEKYKDYVGNSMWKAYSKFKERLNILKSNSPS